MGAGKTTAIETLSEIAVVRTEANNSDRATADKATTTVALDYGEITIDGQDKVRLYGVPGQKRFDFMWSILEGRAKGLILLVNQDAHDPVAQMNDYLEQFDELCRRGGVVVGVTRSDVGPRIDLDEYAESLSERFPDTLIPVFTVDPRERHQMISVLITLIAGIESRNLLAKNGATS